MPCCVDCPDLDTNAHQPPRSRCCRDDHIAARLAGDPSEWEGHEKARAKADAQSAPKLEPELPDGLWERDGELFYECLGCERAVRLEIDSSEYDPEMAYCGGSPRCLR